jgi:FkbM family methyltransferase
MAKKVGATGHVWAFEPAAITAQFLAQGIATNGFAHVTLEQKAVSSVPGSGQLGLNVHSELRSIVHGAPPPNGGEAVSLVTLDDCMDRYRWVDIDLIKIDAEGEEANILKGGRRFFLNLAPLVQYELRNASEMNLDLIRDFEAIGYDSYRLLPSLNLLVPFDAESPADPYLLNLFSCKAARAERLAQRGVLLRSIDLAATGNSRGTNQNAAESAARYHWRHALAHMPYAVRLATAWISAEKSGESVDIQQAMSLYARSRDTALSMAERYRALEASFMQFTRICRQDPSHLRLASLARVAHDFGERRVAVNALAQLVESIRLNGGVDSNEPFLAPLERFDSIEPREPLHTWILGAVLEQLEKRERLSSFYAGPTARDRLEAIHALGFGSAEMERRLDLVYLRINKARAAKGLPPIPSPKP